MTKVMYGNGTSTDYSYDIDNLRLQNLKTLSPASAIQDLSYTFDAVGNVLSITDNSDNGTNSQTFQYDDLDRLISATGAGYQTIDYAYDSIGNMTSRTSLRDGGTEAISYTYGEAGAGPHAVTSSLRAEGEAISAYSYDIENRLTEVATPKQEYLSSYEIPLEIGYNFVSIPVITTSRIETILNNSGITDAEISRLNAQADIWEFFIFNNGSVFGTPDFTEFDYGRGYEIYVESNCTLTVSGSTPLTERTLELYSGDHLIGAPTTGTISVEDALPGVSYVSIKAASPSLRGIEDPEAISYVDVTELEAGYSYFINVTSQQTWNIPIENETTTYLYDGDGGRVQKVSSSETVTYIGSSYEITDNREPITENRIKKHIFLGSTRICTAETVDTTTTYNYFHQDHIGSSNVITDETGAEVKLIEYTPYGLTNREEGSYNTDCRFTVKASDVLSNFNKDKVL